VPFNPEKSLAGYPHIHHKFLLGTKQRIINELDIVVKDGYVVFFLSIIPAFASACTDIAFDEIKVSILNSPNQTKCPAWQQSEVKLLACFSKPKKLFNRMKILQKKRKNVYFRKHGILTCQICCSLASDTMMGYLNVHTSEFKGGTGGRQIKKEKRRIKKHRFHTS
jgi:hypothetical protein